MKTKRMFTRLGTLLLLAAFGVLSMSQMASAHTPGKNLSGKEKAVHAKTHKVNKPVKTTKAHTRTIPGKVVSFDGTTLVMMKGNKTYTVTTDANTTFVDRKWQAINKSLIVAGHKVTVKGTVTGLNVVATSVRDIKLPVKSTSTTD